MEEAVDKRLLKILEQLDAEDNRMIPNDKKKKKFIQRIVSNSAIKKRVA